MFIKSIINNNVITSIDKQGDELVLFGKGVGFKAQVGQEIDEQKVQKRFYLEDKGMFAKFKHIVNEVTADELLLTTKIISMAQKELKKPLNDSVYVSLADHIHFVVYRYQKKQNLSNAFLWDLHQFYPNEFRVAQRAVEMINETLHVKLDENEAGFLTFHFVDATLNVNSEYDVTALTDLMHAIIDIVSFNLHLQISSDDMNSFRFITHVKFFAQRVLQGIKVTDKGDEDLYEIIRVKYNDASATVTKITEFLIKEYHYEMSISDKLYFLVHVHRLLLHSTT
ncbi:PRD domain-containing protein [Pediococcus siamensis]|uniref:PRD domain-containing protein n=1 Tax=Pediococcus siamensis TaxID=381829 RepID=UPI00399F5F91